MQAFAKFRHSIIEGNASICFDLLVLGFHCRVDGKMCKTISQTNFDESANSYENVQNVSLS